MKIGRSIRKWWEGEFVENIGGSVVFLNHVRRHWTARMARSVIDYARENHRWLIATAIAAVGLVIAALKYPK
jgi:phage gp46-like protein